MPAQDLAGSDARRVRRALTGASPLAVVGALALLPGSDRGRPGHRRGGVPGQPGPTGQLRRRQRLRAGGAASGSNAPVGCDGIDLDGPGYWMVAADGGIFNYGDAGFFGSAGSVPLNEPIVGMAAMPDGGGYWLVASDGGIFNYGDAELLRLPRRPTPQRADRGHGRDSRRPRLLARRLRRWDLQLRRRRLLRLARGGQPLNQPIVGMAATHDGGGLLVRGARRRHLQLRRRRLPRLHGRHAAERPIVGMASAPQGYWMVALGRGHLQLRHRYYGSMGGQPNPNPIRGMAATPDGGGYWILPTRPRRYHQLSRPAPAAPRWRRCNSSSTRRGTGSTPRTARSTTAPNRPSWRSRRRRASRETGWSGRPPGRRSGRASPPSSSGGRLRDPDRPRGRPVDGREQRPAGVDAQHVDRRRLHVHRRRVDVGRRHPDRASSRRSGSWTGPWSTRSAPCIGLASSTKASPSTATATSPRYPSPTGARASATRRSTGCGRANIDPIGTTVWVY